MPDVLLYLLIFLGGGFVGPGIRRLLPQPVQSFFDRSFQQISKLFTEVQVGKPTEGVILLVCVLASAIGLALIGRDEAQRSSFLFVTAVFILGMVCGPAIRKLLPTFSKKWLDAVYLWLSRFWQGRAETSEVKAGDLIGLAALAATAIAIFYGVRDASLQASKESLTSETRQLREQIVTHLERIRQQDERIRILAAEQKVPQLTRPGPDANLIGRHVDLAWEYKDHSRFVNYLVQYMQLSGGSSDVPGCGSVKAGQLSTYPATDPAGQRSRLPNVTSLELCPGTYYWRVLPVGFTTTSPSNFEAKLSDWSAFESFTVDSSIKQRIRRTGRIRVGTNFLQDTQFSRRGENGIPEGYDIDLITVIVEGCLALDEGATNTKRGPPVFNLDQCNKAVDAWVQNPTQAKDILKEVGKIKVDFVPITTFGGWPESLQKKEIDMFIGTATKAQAREQGDIRFSDGYYDFRTEVVVKANDPCNDVDCLVKIKSRVGVIQDTTNYKLAELLKEGTKDRVEVVPFLSFPALENALDEGDIRAMIIDSILADPMISDCDFRELPGLEKAHFAWQRYREYIGSQGHEKFGIAVALDSDDRGRRSDDTLLGELNKALGSRPIGRLKRMLENHFLKLAQPTSNCSTGGE